MCSAPPHPLLCTQAARVLCKVCAGLLCSPARPHLTQAPGGTPPPRARPSPAPPPRGPGRRPRPRTCRGNTTPSAGGRRGRGEGRAGEGAHRGGAAPDTAATPSSMPAVAAGKLLEPPRRPHRTHPARPRRARAAGSRGSGRAGPAPSCPASPPPPPGPAGSALGLWADGDLRQGLRGLVTR